jgi:cytochrome c oxidase subunit IV
MKTHIAHAHSSHQSLYLKIFWALMALLVLTVIAAKIPFPGQGNIAIALTIAIVKGALIVMFFMHFRDSDHLVWLVGAATVAWFLILIFMTLNDYNTRDLISSMPGK